MSPDSIGLEGVNNGNFQSSSDFWLFVVYCLVVVVVVLFFLFYFNRVLAQILTWLINQYTWRRYNAYVQFDSIRVTLLGARILFKNLRYLSTNQSISIVKGHISIQYWLMNVRKADSEKTASTTPDNVKSKLPCRIVCSIEGLEWFIYNNTPAYKSMRDILGMSAFEREGTSTATSELHINGSQNGASPGADDPEKQTPAAAVEASLIQRLMPIQFECTTGAVIIGNSELSTMIVGHFAQASGIWSTEESRTEMDHYRSVADLVFRKCQISLKDNMDFVVQQNDSDQPAVVSSGGEGAVATMQHYASMFLGPLISLLMFPIRILFNPWKKGGRFAHVQHGPDMARSHRDPSAMAQPSTFHEEYARVSNVLECSKMAVLYYSDVAGPVPSTGALGSSGVGIDVGNGGLPPEWGVRLLLWNAMFHYGPWADRQRSALQDYFFPSSHRNNVPTAFLRPGDLRVATAFEFHVDLMTEATFRVPTREKSKDWKFDSESEGLDIGTDGYYTRPYGWIDIKTGPGSTLKTVVPFVIGIDGTTVTNDLHLKDVIVSTSVNYASLLQTACFDLSLAMHSPLIWNAHREWEINTSIKKPEIFLLRDHVFLIQDLIKDWGSTPAPDLLHFIPVTYKFAINISEPWIYLCVNEHNIISNPNDLQDNAFIRVRSSKLKFTMSLPFTDYQPEVTTINFHADIEQFDIGISLQSSHTLSAFMQEDDARFGVSVNAEIYGSYESYSTVDVLRHIESLNLNIKMNGVTCKLFGTVIRYLMILRDNYAGSWINFSTIDEYRQRRANPQKHLELKRRHAESKVSLNEKLSYIVKQNQKQEIQDPFEVYVLVDVQDGSLLLPENLYDCSHYSQMDFQELQLELRNLDIYMDMYVNVSPITWTRESHTDPSSKKTFIRARNVRDQGNFLYIDELNIYAHRLFGPLPETSTYLCHWDFEVGRISGEVKPSFLLGTTNFAQTFAYDMIDEDNAVPSEIAPAADPDVTFLKATIKQVDLYLMNEHSAAKVALEEGIQVEFDNLVNDKYNQRVCVSMPTFVVTALANQDHHIRGQSIAEGDYSWVEVARLSTGVNTTVYRHTKEWRKLRKAQQNFIRAQDYATRRCVHLYQKNTESPDSQNNADQHVGVLYAPLYKSVYLTGEGMKDAESNTLYLVQPSGGQNGMTNVAQSFAGASDKPSVGSYVRDWGNASNDDIYNDQRSRKSAVSNDNESFHTAYSNDEFADLHNLILTEELYHLSSESLPPSDSEDEYPPLSVSHDEKQTSKATEATPGGTTIPPSIPYSGYLHRYSVKTASQAGNRGNSFFQPYLPPPKTCFIPLKQDNFYSSSDDSGSANPFTRKRESPLFLFPGSTEPLNGSSYMDEDEIHVYEDDDDAIGNEVVVTTVLEATSPLQVLMTPILVKIVQEVSEAINRYDWDLESMMDSLQIEYVSQLTRYLTDQFVCTQFAVSLPSTHFHFIQNVMLPDDLPSYKDGRSHISAQYDEKDTTLCTADIFLKDFSMIGNVKFQDEAYDEKKRSVAESKMVLRESRVHIDLGNLECKVQYVSAGHHPPTTRQHMVFGIPGSRQHFSQRASSTQKNADEENHTTNELVVIDFVLTKFSFKWLGSQKPNYLNIDIGGLSTIIITEAAEILVGAVYAWLVFVDDFKSILQTFQNQRTNQIQMFIHEVSLFSKHPATTGDPLFLTKPTTVLRLGSRNFRNDVGWKLLARMRYCLRAIDAGQRASLQYKLSRGSSSLPLNSRQMFEAVVQTLALWRSWEINAMEIANCRLLTQTFNHRPHDTSLDQRHDKMEKLVSFLISSVNLAKINIRAFDFCIFEEEQEMDDNSISITEVEVGLECVYKRSPIERHHQDEAIPRASGESDRRYNNPSQQRDGYLDVISKAGIGSINITINPTILAFARHMLTVQRLFTAKLRNLVHTTAAPSSLRAEASSSVAVMNDSFDIKTIVNKIDIVAQALLTVRDIDVCARAQKLTMQSTVRGIQGSLIFSNPKLTPLPFFASSDKADSDTGSGLRSSAKASNKRHNPGNQSSRLILEAGGLIEFVDVRFYEMKGQTPHTQFSELLVITLDGINVNANISQPTRLLRKQSRSSEQNAGKEVLNVFSNIHKFSVHAPQSVLRLYEFIEDWRTEQGQRYQFLFQNLLNEWEEQRKATALAAPLALDDIKKKKLGGSASLMNTGEKRFDLKLQFLLNEFDIRFDLLPSLIVQYTINDFFMTVNETQVKADYIQQRYAAQLSKQEIHLITKSSPLVAQQHPQKQPHDEYAGGTFSIPGIRSTGNFKSETVNGVSQRRMRFTVFVDFIALTLNVNMIDSFLTAHSLLGNEIGELVEVLSYDKKKRGATVAVATSSGSNASNKDSVAADTTMPGTTQAMPWPSQSPQKITYSMDISLNGLRIAADSPSAIGVFESNALDASLSNELHPDHLMWKVKGSNFALSLEHTGDNLAPGKEEPHQKHPMADKSYSKSDTLKLYQRNRLAYIVMDFDVHNYSPKEDNMNEWKIDPFHISVSRIQTVMQPIALGKLADMYIYYDMELKKKKELKKTELDRIASNTKRLVQSFKSDIPTHQNIASHSLLEGKLLSVNVRRIGIAIPLDASSPEHHHHSSSSTSALLLSVTSIQFLSKNVEKSVATLEDISLQFVKRFDQNNEDHFLAEKHPRMNQMHLPSIACHVYTRNIKPKQYIKIDAKVGGFEVDIDGSLSDYINALNVIYVKSKDRVDAFTRASVEVGGPITEAATAAAAPSLSDPGKSDFSNSEIVYLDIEGMLEYQSGMVRMYPRRHSSEVARKRSRSITDRRASSSSSSKMATVKVPGLTAWFTYQTPVGAHASISDSPRRFHSDIVIHESENVLHPSLVQFLQETIAGLKIGMQQSTERKAAAAIQSPTSTVDKNINASLMLRLSRTRLDLSCQPASKVICSLSWDESTFLMNAFSTAQDTTLHTMSCVGSIQNVVAVVKHHFSPEPCLLAKFDHIDMNAMLTSERRHEDKTEEDDISIVLKMPSMNVDLNMRHLQDLLILNTFWFDQKGHGATSGSRAAGTSTSATLGASLGEPTTTSSASSSRTEAPKPFSRHISVHVERIILSVDIGQAIGKVCFMPENFGITTHIRPMDTRELSVYLNRIKVAAEGRLTGDAQFEQIMLQVATNVVNDCVVTPSTRQPSLYLLMNAFRATFEYEYQHILDLAQEPIEFSAGLIGNRELELSMTVKPLLACVSVKTVPVMITMYKRFAELLRKKMIEAGVSDTLPYSPRTTAPPHRHGFAGLPSSSSSLRKTVTATTSIIPPTLNCSKAEVHFHSVELVIYPSQFQDTDNIELVAQHLRLTLIERPIDDQTMHRDLTMRLNSAALRKNVPGTKLMIKRNSAIPMPTTISALQSEGTDEIYGRSAARVLGVAPHQGTRTATTTATTAAAAKNPSSPPIAAVPNVLKEQKTIESSGGVSIFGIPSVMLQMESDQRLKVVDHKFSASFGGRIDVSLNLGLIRYLQELANMFTNQMNRALHNERGSEEDLLTTSGNTRLPSGVVEPAPRSVVSSRRSDPSAGDGGPSVLEKDTKASAIKSSGNAPAAASSRTQGEEFVYSSTTAVNFDPQLEIMGEATPPVEWLGFKRERLPALVHENITLVLGELIETLWRMYSM
ncbi:hypothetical protein BX666DRAFT_2151466 [Dichotomocladium elegans]|nr:hypothetical protein BX666DRAFT_2151466 [Dichotomocladium elegans]